MRGLQKFMKKSVYYERTINGLKNVLCQKYLIFYFHLSTNIVKPPLLTFLGWVAEKTRSGKEKPTLAK